MGFYGLLRAGKLLAFTFDTIEMGGICTVISLPVSRSGLCTGARKAIAVRDTTTLDLLRTLAAVSNAQGVTRLWPYLPQAFRTAFYGLCRKFRVCYLKFKPYSLRRGGATFLLQQGLALELVLIRRRWKRVFVVRLYLEDSLFLILLLRLAANNYYRVVQFTSQTPEIAFRPMS